MDTRSYTVVTAAYWAFTLTDGALRMLVLLYFHEQGLTAIQLAFLFLLYEFCGIITNLFGGWLASSKGLKITLTSGLLLQIIPLLLLSLVPRFDWDLGLIVSYIMGTQALSGIAKDLTKMSSKSAVRVLVPQDHAQAQSGLFKWVALLTGSKNALKGVGFFLGGFLLTTLGFEWSLWTMAIGLSIVLTFSQFALKGDLGRSKKKTAFKELFSKTREINQLSIARFFLFASRDIWFVVGLPLFLSSVFNWTHTRVGSYLALWVIGYGIVQATVPLFLRKQKGNVPRTAGMTFFWGFILLLVSFGLSSAFQMGLDPKLTIIGGLIIFGIIFAINSTLHSYLILAYSDSDKAALNVGFYYMANAGGRLIGTLLSGLTYQFGGFQSCLWLSSASVALAVFFTATLPRSSNSS